MFPDRKPKKLTDRPIYLNRFGFAVSRVAERFVAGSDYFARTFVKIKQKIYKPVQIFRLSLTFCVHSSA